TGIGPNESYTLDFDFDCDGSADLRLGVKNNQLVQLLPGPVHTIPGDYKFVGNSLEVRFDDVMNLFPPGADPCNARVTLTANAEFDGLGEDRTSAVQLEVTPHLTVS